MFVYDKELKFIGVYFIRDGSNNFEEGVKNIGNAISSSILFTSIGGTYSVRMYRSGGMVADYYHSESKGIWRFRCIKEVKDACKQICTGGNLEKEKNIEKIIEIIFELSFDKTGAMIVICDDEELETKLKDGKRATGNIELSNINTLSNNQIKDYAAMDGAIVLSSDGTIREIGTILPIDDITNDNNCRYHTKYEQWCNWKAELSKKQKGARHTTAIKFSLQHEDACVFIVSENRGISIFNNGKAILWDDGIPY
jgi:DNA integrity scanning protein DisA with diadenylate cyclase activity